MMASAELDPVSAADINGVLNHASDEKETETGSDSEATVEIGAGNTADAETVPDKQDIGQLMEGTDTGQTDQATEERDYEQTDPKADAKDTETEPVKNGMDAQRLEGELDLTGVEDVKEPEEPEHKAECLYEQTSPETEPTIPKPEGESTEKTEKSEEQAKDKAAEKDEKDGWMWVLGHDKLKKKTIKKGDGGRPHHGQLVKMRYKGMLPDGTEVDRNDNANFTLGDGDIIQALDICAALTNLREVALVMTHPQYAFGQLGRTGEDSPDIPPNSELTYEIEILEFIDEPKFYKLTITERVDWSDKKRERGNYLYARNEYSLAINLYSKAIKIVDTSSEKQVDETPETLQELVDMRVKCYNNMAAAQIKAEAFDAALKSCEEVLRAQPQNVKALFRKGKCLSGKGETEAAIMCLEKALAADPGAKILHNELSKLKRLKKQEEAKQRSMYEKMLGTSKKSKAVAVAEQKSRWRWYTGGAVAAALVSVGIAAYRYMHM